MHFVLYHVCAAVAKIARILRQYIIVVGSIFTAKIDRCYFSSAELVVGM